MIFLREESGQERGERHFRILQICLQMFPFHQLSLGRAGCIKDTERATKEGQLAEGTQSEERVRPFLVFSSHALCLLFSRGAFGREDSEAGDGVSRMLHAHEVECEGSLTLEGKERPGWADLVLGWKSRGEQCLLYISSS